MYPAKWSRVKHQSEKKACLQKTYPGKKKHVSTVYRARSKVTVSNTRVMP